MAIEVKPQGFEAVLETFPLVAPDAYDVLETQPTPDALIVETFSDQTYLNNGELAGRVVPMGYGEATLQQPLDAGGSVAFAELGGPFFVRDGFRKRTVIASSLYSTDTDYAVELRHSGDKLLDVHGVALRFNEDQSEQMTDGQSR